MALLKDIAAGNIYGTAPTPVLAYAINHYLVNDPLMNVMEFAPIGQGMVGSGNMQASVVHYNGDGAAAAFRGIGLEYDPDNEVPHSETVQLKILGGSYTVDRAIVRGLGKTPGAVSNWAEQQVIQKTNKVKNGFAKYFMLGNKTTDAKQFDGLNVFFASFTNQVMATPFDLSGDLTADKAMRLERHLNQAINKIRPKTPNVVVTTESGKTLLQTLNAYRNRGVDVVEVDGLKYNQYMGIKVIPLTDDCFSDEDKTDKTPFVFMYIHELDGIRTAIPMDGKVIDITSPVDGNGTVVKEAAVEMICAPLFVNPFAASKCFITETALPVAADKTALLNAIVLAQPEVEADYTAGSWATFETALTAALAANANANATQAAVDTATSNLTAAQAALVAA